MKDGKPDPTTPLLFKVLKLLIQNGPSFHEKAMTLLSENSKGQQDDRSRYENHMAFREESKDYTSLTDPSYLEFKKMPLFKDEMQNEPEEEVIRYI